MAGQKPMRPQKIKKNLTGINKEVLIYFICQNIWEGERKERTKDVTEKVI